MARVVVRDVVGDPNEVHSFPAAGLPFDVPNNAFVQALQDYLEGYAVQLVQVLAGELLGGGFANHVPVTIPVIASDSLSGDAYSETILANTLGNVGLLQRTLCGYISTDDSIPGGLTIEVSFGGTATTLVQVDEGSMTPSLVKAPFKINLDLAAKNDESIQVLYCDYIQDGNVTFLKRLELTVDSRQDQDLKVSVTMTQSSANNIVAIESGG